MCDGTLRGRRRCRTMIVRLDNPSEDIRLVKCCWSGLGQSSLASVPGSIDGEWMVFSDIGSTSAVSAPLSDERIGSAISWLGVMVDGVPNWAATWTQFSYLTDKFKPVE